MPPISQYGLIISQKKGIIMDLMPKTILITGASRGIGAAVAIALASPSNNIIINYHHSRAAADEIAERCRRKGARAITVAADISDPDAVEAMFTRAEAEFGTVHCLINNAGISVYGMLQDISPEQWDRVFQINVRGTFLCTKRAIPRMISERQGRIVNIASIWGLVGASCESLYSATKGAIIAFTKACAKELVYSGITANVLAPGVVNTDMMRQISKSDLDDVVNELPMGRMIEPEEIASWVAHLIAEDAACLTGQVISPNGGMLI